LQRNIDKDNQSSSNRIDVVKKLKCFAHIPLVTSRIYSRYSSKVLPQIKHYCGRWLI